jgi:hypothetical protein
MKRKTFLLIALFGMISSHLIQTRIGCLAKSKQLKEAFDTKSYHPVDCNCPCDLHQAKGRPTAPRNECLECGHFHDAQPMILVTKIIKTTLHRPDFMHTPQESLQLLIGQYRTTKNNH